MAQHGTNFNYKQTYLSIKEPNSFSKQLLFIVELRDYVTCIMIVLCWLQAVCSPLNTDEHTTAHMLCMHTAIALASTYLVFVDLDLFIL